MFFSFSDLGKLSADVGNSMGSKNRSNTKRLEIFFSAPK